MPWPPVRCCKRHAAGPNMNPIWSPKPQDIAHTDIHKIDRYIYISNYIYYIYYNIEQTYNIHSYSMPYLSLSIYVHIYICVCIIWIWRDMIWCIQYSYSCTYIYMYNHIHWISRCIKFNFTGPVSWPIPRFIRRLSWLMALRGRLRGRLHGHLRSLRGAAWQRSLDALSHGKEIHHGMAWLSSINGI